MKQSVTATSSQGHNTTKQADLAQFALLDDLHRYGVTTAMSERAHGIFQDFAPVGALHQHNTREASQKAHQPAPESRAPESAASQSAASKSPASLGAQDIPPNLKPPQQTLKKEAAKNSTPPPRHHFAPEKYISSKQGSLPLTVLLTCEEGAVHPLAFSDAQEKKLWFAVMRAIGVTPENTENDETEQIPSYVMVVGDAALDGNLIEAEEALLQQAVARKLSQNDIAPKAVLAVGGRAHRLLSPEKGRGSDAQTPLKQDFSPPLYTIYQLQAMLRQPALKRQTWATLLELKKVLS